LFTFVGDDFDDLVLVDDGLLCLTTGFLDEEEPDEDLGISTCRIVDELASAIIRL
jgi:hypothetical protein